MPNNLYILSVDRQEPNRARSEKKMKLSDGFVSDKSVCSWFKITVVISHFFFSLPSPSSSVSRSYDSLDSPAPMCK